MFFVVLICWLVTCLAVWTSISGTIVNYSQLFLSHFGRDPPHGGNLSRQLLDFVFVNTPILQVLSEQLIDFSKKIVALYYTASI